MKNEYVCVEIEKVDDFIERIEELESRDFVTMSAGRTDKGAWYAILRRDAHAQMKLEAPKDEATELLEAARKIKAACEGREYCESNGGCPFSIAPGGCCVSSESPCGWEV